MSRRTDMLNETPPSGRVFNSFVPPKQVVKPAVSEADRELPNQIGAKEEEIPMLRRASSSGRREGSERTAKKVAAHQYRICEHQKTLRSFENLQQILSI